MIGRDLKSKLTALMCKHNVKPIERPPLPLLPATDGPQIVEGLAASADVDAERTSFAPGSLSWPDDLSKLPLLVRHSDKVAGKILSLDYRPDGRLFICARVDDSEARRMAGFSIAATIIASEVRDQESPTGFHFVITSARIDEISLSPAPSNAAALVTSRRNVSPVDRSADDVLAAANRARKALEELRKTWSQPVAKAKAAPEPTRNIAPATPLIYGDIPMALMTRPRTQFGALVARLPIGGE
jgi:hypothetical protein